MYAIKATLSIKGQQPKHLLEGIFVPKDEECEAAKIRQQCHDFIMDNMVKRDFNREELSLTISFKKLPTDFVVVEDKPVEL